MNSPITISTDKGYFATSGNGETLSQFDGHGYKAISGTLDSITAKITIIFEGRQPVAGVTSLVVPAVNELGTPNFTVSAGSSGGMTATSAVLPSLIGPPNKIALSVTNPVSQTNAYFDNLASTWGYTDQTLAVKANVTDLVGQQVLANMPMWVGQAWRAYVPSSTIPYDYMGVQGAATIGNPFYLTLDNGGNASMPNLVATGFGSNYSGQYTVECFALSPNYSQSALTPLTNLSDPTQMSVAQQNALPTDSTLAAQVSATQNVIFDSYVDLNGWLNVKGTIQRITDDGTMSSTINFSGQDTNGKPVLPGTPFSASAELMQTSTVSDIIYSLGAGTLYLTSGAQIKATASNNDPANDLYFDTQSNGYVIARGNSLVGQMKLTLNNLRPNGLTNTSFSDVADVYGPDPFLATSSVIDPTTAYQCKVSGLKFMIMPGSDENNPNTKSISFTVPVNSQGGQPYPDGYILTLCDNGNPVYTNMALQQAELIGGTVSFTYSPALGYNPGYTAHLSVEIEGEGVGAHINALQPLSFIINGGLTPATLDIERPLTATFSPTFTTPIHLATADTFSFGALYVYNYLTAPVLNGYPIACKVIASAGTPPAAEAALPKLTASGGNTDQFGSISNPTGPTLNTGSTPCWISVEALYTDTNNNIFSLGNSGDIHVGLLTPTLAAAANQPTPGSITLNITDPNPPGEAATYQVGYEAVGGTQWLGPVIVPAPALTCTIPGSDQWYELSVPGAG